MEGLVLGPRARLAGALAKDTTDSVESVTRALWSSQVLIGKLSGFLLCTTAVVRWLTQLLEWKDLSESSALLSTATVTQSLPYTLVASKTLRVMHSNSMSKSLTHSTSDSLSLLVRRRFRFHLQRSSHFRRSASMSMSFPTGTASATTSRSASLSESQNASNSESLTGSLSKSASISLSLPTGSQTQSHTLSQSNTFSATFSYSLRKSLSLTESASTSMSLLTGTANLRMGHPSRDCPHAHPHPGQFRAFIAEGGSFSSEHSGSTYPPTTTSQSSEKAGTAILKLGFILAWFGAARFADLKVLRRAGPSGCTSGAGPWFRADQSPIFRTRHSDFRTGHNDCTQTH